MKLDIYCFWSLSEVINSFVMIEDKTFANDFLMCPLKKR